MCKSWFAVAGIICFAFATSSPVSGQTALIDELVVPSQRQWCLARSMPAADLNDPIKQQQHLTIAIRAIAIAAAKTNKPSIGMPAVTKVMAGATKDDPVTVTFCSNVTAAEVPSGVTDIKATDRGVARVVAASCGAVDVDKCDQQLTDALLADPWKFTKDEVAAMSATTGETTLVGTVKDQAVAAINSADVLVYDKASDGVVTLPVFGVRTTIIAYQLP